MLAVSEIYGPVLQGEGHNLGEPTLFLRLMGCNLKCTWCDTAYTWDSSRFNLKEELTRMTIEEVGKQLQDLSEASGIGEVDISGGEPLLQQEALGELFSLPNLNLWWSVETAGTIIPDAMMLGNVEWWNVSPKLASSGNGMQRRNWEALHVLNSGSTTRFKFVASSEDDFDEIDHIVEVVGIAKPHVYIMPEGVTAEAILRHSALLEPYVIARGYNLTTRLHILMHGNKRGI